MCFIRATRHYSVTFLPVKATFVPLACRTCEFLFHLQCQLCRHLYLPQLLVLPHFRFQYHTLYLQKSMVFDKKFYRSSDGPIWLHVSTLKTVIKWMSQTQNHDGIEYFIQFTQTVLIFPFCHLLREQLCAADAKVRPTLGKTICSTHSILSNIISDNCDTIFCSTGCMKAGTENRIQIYRNQTHPIGSVVLLTKVGPFCNTL